MTLKRDDRLKDKIAVITGAGSGIGRATALRYAASGAKIVCADLKANGPDISTPTHEEINATYGSERATFVACDVTDEESIKSLIQKAVAFGGRLDIVCNYAGISVEWTTPQRQRIHETDIALYDKTMAVNVRGIFLSCKYAIQQMLQQDPHPPNNRGDRTRGWIINAASIVGLITAPHIPCYATSKHAVVGLTKQMAIDYALDRIHCNALCPGFVDTPFITPYKQTQGWTETVTSLHPWNALGTAEDIANAAVFLASDEAAWVTGHTMVIDGGFTCQ